MTATPDRAALTNLLQEAEARHDAYRAAGLALDLTRGKPATAQLDLSDALDGVLDGDYRTEDGTDARNYGGLLGIPECRRLAARSWSRSRPGDGSGIPASPDDLFMETAHLFGIGDAPPWKDGGPALPVPVPGYDRHFTVCEASGSRWSPLRWAKTAPAWTPSRPSRPILDKGHLVRTEIFEPTGWCTPMPWSNAWPRCRGKRAPASTCCGTTPTQFDLDDAPQLADLLGAADAHAPRANGLIGSTSRWLRQAGVSSSRPGRQRSQPSQNVSHDDDRLGQGEPVAHARLFRTWRASGRT